jgi:hypothetical protein
VSDGTRRTLEDERLYAEGLEPWALQCRTLRHAWMYPEQKPERISDGGKRIWFECERCGTERIVFVDRYGRRKNRYYYPEGYQRTGGGSVTSQVNTLFWGVFLRGLGAK